MEKHRWFAVLFIFLLVGCYRVQTPTISPTPQLLNSSTIETPTIYATSTLAPFLLKTPTATILRNTQSVAPTTTILPTPEVPFLPVPTNTLSSQGPWGIIPANNGLWVMQADGSGLTQVYKDGSVIQLAISPVGKNVAFISHSSKDENIPWTSGFTLNLITAPEWKTHFIASLDLQDTGKAPADDFHYNAAQVGYALWMSSLVWSPDGRYLAFISAHDGSSADVYVYIASTGEIRRLTDGSSQAFGLSWSPDSRHIFHSGAYDFGTGAGYGVAGAWVVSVDGKEVKQVMPAGDGNASILGWVTKDIILVYSWSQLCGNDNLRQINFQNGDERVLWPGCMGSFVYEPQKNQILITNIESYSDINGNEVSKKGTFLVTPGQDGYRKLSDEGYEKLFIGSDSAAWYGFIGWKGLFALKSDGQVIAAYTDFPYNVGRPADYFQDRNLFFYLNWGTVQIDIIKPGGEILGTTSFDSESFSFSPVDPDLIFSAGFTSTGSGLYAIRYGEWKSWLISSQVDHGQGVYWLP